MMGFQWTSLKKWKTMGNNHTQIDPLAVLMDGGTKKKGKALGVIGYWYVFGN